MPHKYFNCPDPNFAGRDKEGRVPIDVCLTHSRTDDNRGCNWTFPVLSYLIQVERDYLSPTMLQRCPREVFLKNATDYSVDPAKAWLRLRGTLQHSGLEKYPDGLVETTWERDFELDGVNYKIRGTIDCLRPEKGVIRDWKTVKSIKGKSFFGGGLPAADHVEQISVYRWLVAGGKCVISRGQKVPTGIDYPLGELVYIDPENHARFSNISLWSSNVVEDLMRFRLPLLARMLSNGIRIREWRREGSDGSAPTGSTQEIAPVLPYEEQWKCGYCDVLRECQLLSEREGTEPVDPRSSKQKKADAKLVAAREAALDVSDIEF